MYCSQCGTQLQEDQEVCPACDARVGKRKRGFWQRLLGFFGTPVSSTTTVIKEEKIVFINEKTGTRTVFNSFDELPPEIKAKFEQAKEGKFLIVNSFDELPPEIKAKFEQAKVLPCNSFDELPPEIKAKFEQAKLLGEGITKSFLFTVRSSEGKEETYHSLEEMPPAVRALYEAVVKDVPPEVRNKIENWSDEKESLNDRSAHP